MLKCSDQLVPLLVNFYNTFTKHYYYDLSYKFDPIILTPKYERIMNKIDSKKKMFPKLFECLAKNDTKNI
jgi:hypothetical protein